jgi:hypothetical protein
MKTKSIGGMRLERGATILGVATVAIATGLLASGCGAVDDASLGEEEQVESESSALSVTATQSLLITMTSVTRSASRTLDPCNAQPGDENKIWTIGHMLKREAEKNGVTPSDYVSNWMNAWTGTVNINGQTVPALIGPLVRTYWERFAGGNTTLSLHKAPFYLLAIVNRPDLRKHRPLGEPLGGEVRFVFGVLGANQVNPPCPSTSYDPVSTIILEYSPAKADEIQVRDFASRWLALSSLSGVDYRAALSTLTEEVINSGRLLRIRTNDGPIAGKVGGTSNGWDLGEFEPDPTTKFLKRTQIKQSPTMALNGGSQRMSDWIWTNRTALFANAFDYEIGRLGSRTVTDLPIGSYSVPDTFPGTNIWFRGGLNSLVSSNEFWGGPTPTGMPPGQSHDWSEARFRFSVGTCRGCHGAETATGGFLHILPNTPGTEAGRSAFLRGSVNVVDPVNPNISRQFNEMFRRENDLRGLVNLAPVLVPVLGNNYTVRFSNSGKCLDSAGDNSNDGAFSQLWSCHERGNQRLSLVSVGTNVYNLKYKHSGKCLDVENAPGSQNASTNPNARVVQRSCVSGRTSQRVTLSTIGGAPLGTPAPRLVQFQHSNLCMLVENQATLDGTRIIQATCPTSPYTAGFNLVE